jgi:hypothetical protein
LSQGVHLRSVCFWNQTSRLFSLVNGAVTNWSMYQYGCIISNARFDVQGTADDAYTRPAVCQSQQRYQSMIWCILHLQPLRAGPLSSPSCSVLCRSKGLVEVLITGTQSPTSTGRGARLCTVLSSVLVHWQRSGSMPKLMSMFL